MKRCPDCKRTYADDTLTFCLADGALLSAPYDPHDPHETLRFPPPQRTEPSPVGVWPDQMRRPSEPPRRNKLSPVYIGLIILTLLIVGGLAIWLVMEKKGNSTEKSELTPTSSTPNITPSPLPGASLSAEKTPRVEPSPTPTPSNTPDLSYLTGTYDLYRLENPSSGVIGTMSIKVGKGNDIFVRGTDWTGTGRMDGKQGYYDWTFEDEKHGRTTILVNDDGTLQGRVFGSGIDWWYLARRQK
jgi:hypothetical protein